MSVRLCSVPCVSRRARSLIPYWSAVFAVLVAFCFAFVPNAAAQTNPYLERYKPKTLTAEPADTPTGTPHPAIQADSIVRPTLTSKPVRKAAMTSGWAYRRRVAELHRQPSLRLRPIRLHSASPQPTAAASISKSTARTSVDRSP